MPNLEANAAQYRYFTTDLLSNTLLAEIPFKGVSFERSIKGAGGFQGTIAVIPETDSMSLYDFTMPGKTGLYVMRNGVCVWGGIIWGRDYNLVSRELSVDASEFTSYLHHRRIWKNWSHEYGGTVTMLVGGVGVVTLDSGFTYPFEAGSTVGLSFREVGNFKYNGYYPIRAVPAPTTTTFQITAIGIPPGVYPLTTVTVRTDTYDYVRGLIDSMQNDFSEQTFPNSEIEPGIGVPYRITNKQAANGVATLTMAENHDMSVGQGIIVRNVVAFFNGQYTITAIPAANKISYAKTGTATSTAVSVVTRNVSRRKITNYVARLTTSVAHGFSVGQRVVISGVDPASSTAKYFDGAFIVTAVPSATTFEYLTSSVTDTLDMVSLGTATLTAEVLSGSYGPYAGNADIGLRFDELGYSGIDVEPIAYRGFELKNIGDELDKYSDSVDGFEYRVDCEYDAGTASFQRIFKLIPIDFPDPPPTGEISPPSRFGADELIFEYPGNIMDISIAEKSDDATTRFWMVGDIGDLGADAAKPYSAAADRELLLDGWPLLEDVESDNDTADEEVLYSYAKRYLGELRAPIGDIDITVNGSMSPVVGDYFPGDWCCIIADDPFVLMRLASDLEPRDTVIVRKINSIKVTIPDTPSYPEKVDLKLIAEWEVDRRGE